MVVQSISRKGSTRALASLAVSIIVGLATETVPIAGSQTIDHAAHHAKQPAVTLTTTPRVPRVGRNVVTVTVKMPDGSAVLNADVSVEFVVPALRGVGTVETRRMVALARDESPTASPGAYTGEVDIPTAGKWNVTVTVKVGGVDFATQKLTLTVE